MISPAYIQTMARYNRWQNASIYEAASTLTDAQRKDNRGAFFGSVYATLNHLLWADQMWLSRFSVVAPPAPKTIGDSVDFFAEWADLSRARIACDEIILNWSETVDPAWLATELTWFSGALGSEVTSPQALLVVHLFNHQTHHRGQAHAMLTGLGATPGVTDLPFMP